MMYLDTSTLTQKQEDFLLFNLKNDADAIFNQWDIFVSQFCQWMKINFSLDLYKEILFIHI